MKPCQDETELLKTQDEKKTQILILQTDSSINRVCLKCENCASNKIKCQHNLLSRPILESIIRFFFVFPLAAWNNILSQLALDRRYVIKICLASRDYISCGKILSDIYWMWTRRCDKEWARTIIHNKLNIKMEKSTAPDRHNKQKRVVNHHLRCSFCCRWLAIAVEF